MHRINSCVRTVVVGLALAGLAGATVAQTTQKADESRIQKLVAQLGDNDFSVREAATKELAAIGPDALPAVKKAAASSDPEVAQRAATVVSQIGKGCFDAACKAIAKDLLWNCPVKDGVAGKISIKDGVAYAAGADHAIHAVDIKTGKEKWSQAQLSEDATVMPSCAIVCDKAALAILDNGDVTGLDSSTGKVTWKYKREQPANPQPAANPVGMPGGGGMAVMVGGGAPGMRGIGQAKPVPAVVGSTLYLPQEESVVVVDAETGKKVKEIKVSSPSMNTPAISGDRMVIHLSDGTVRGYSLSDGSEAWQHAAGATAGCVVCSEGKAYFVGDPATMYALDCTSGKELWQCSLAPDAAGAANPNGNGMVMRPHFVIAGMVSPQDQSVIVKGGTVYTLQGNHIIAVDAKDGKKKLQCQIDAWRDETPDATTHVRNNAMMMRPRFFGQTASSFAIEGNIAYVSGGQFGVYAVGLDDGVARWAFRTSNVPVGDIVLLDGVLYFGTGQQGPSVVRMIPPRAAGGADPAKPAEEAKDTLPEGLHALKVK
jgi:outer membrane protein assembly factor BamB